MAETPMRLAAMPPASRQVAAAAKEAVAKRGGFSLAIPGGSILKAPQIARSARTHCRVVVKHLVLCVCCVRSAQFCLAPAFGVLERHRMF